MIDPSTVRLGRQEHDPAQLAKVFQLAATIDDEEIPEAPVDVGYGRFMTSTPMLGNNEAGDCVIVTILHAIQAVTAAMGRERTFTREEALAIYAELTGWPRVDPGLNMYATLLRWLRDPGLFGGVEIEGIASVNLRDWRKIQQAVWLFGGVLTGFDLPLAWQRVGRWTLDFSAAAAGGEAQVQRGGWGGHAMFGGDRVFVPGGLPQLITRTWGGEQGISSAGCDFYGAEGYIVLLKGQEPVNAPGFDRDRLLRAMRELAR